MQLLRMIFLAVAVLYLQLLAAPHISIIGVMPNLMLAWVLLAAVKLPRSQALILAFLLGVAYDLTSPLSLGLFATLLTIAAEVVHRLHNSWNKSNMVNVVLGVFLLNAGWGFLFAVFHVFAGHGMPLSFAQLTVGLLWQTVSGVIALYFLLLLDRLRLHVER